MIACKNCKFFFRGSGYNPQACKHESCWTEAEVDPIEGKLIMKRILNYHNKNGAGECTDFERRVFLLERFWMR